MPIKGFYLKISQSSQIFKVIPNKSSSILVEKLYNQQILKIGIIFCVKSEQKN